MVTASSHPASAGGTDNLLVRVSTLSSELFAKEDAHKRVSPHPQLPITRVPHPSPEVPRVTNHPLCKRGPGGFFGSSCLFCLCPLVPAKASSPEPQASGPIRWHRAFHPLCERPVLRSLGEAGSEQERSSLTSIYLAPVSPHALSCTVAPVLVFSISFSCPCSSLIPQASGPAPFFSNLGTRGAPPPRCHRHKKLK